MPLKKCEVNGKSGWKWGDQGHCYPGPEGKKNAIKQGVAIEGPDKFKSMAESQLKDFDLIDARTALADFVRKSTSHFLQSVADYFKQNRG